MIRRKRMLENRRNRRMFENVEDPCELLASLVDLGSVDVEDAFLACLSEMSAAECKRVLAKCGMGFAAAEEDEFPADAEDGLEDADDFEESEVEEVEDDEVEDDEVEDDEVSDEEVELESRIRRLEKSFRERCSKNEEDDEDKEDMNERKSCRAESRISARRRFSR